MKRKEFLTKAGLAAGAAVGAPYILPTGRLFARTNAPLAEHVVLVMFAGGVRQQESILQRYLDDSQDLTGYGGNIMYNFFEGASATQKIAFGTDIPGGTRGGEPIPKLLTQTLQKQGTLFREVRAQSAGHFVGLNTLVTGNPGVGQGLKTRPRFPTIFEYLRRHAGFKATDTWLLSNTLTNSFNLLNSSLKDDYGLKYGGNMFVPPVVFGGTGRQILGNAKAYTKSELEPMYEMKNFLDNTFSLGGGEYATIKNTDEEKTKIKEFIRAIYQKQQAGLIASPPVADSGDAINCSYAAEVLKYFKPKFLALNLGAVDSCHSSFTGYVRALHRADHAVAWLWNYIQTSIPEMAGKTVMLIAPECGRNENPNPILDENNWYSYDHSDFNAMRVWSLMVGKNMPSNTERGSENAPLGRLTDIVPTIAEIFGIHDEVRNAGYLDPLSQSFLRRL